MNKQPRLSTVKQHVFMAAIKVTYQRFIFPEGEDGKPDMTQPPVGYNMQAKEMNLVTSQGTKNINGNELNQLRKAALLRMENEFKIVAPEYNFVDVLFNNIFHLGLMSEVEFHAEAPLTAEQPQFGPPN